MDAHLLVLGEGNIQEPFLIFCRKKNTMYVIVKINTVKKHVESPYPLHPGNYQREFPVICTDIKWYHIYPTEDRRCLDIPGEYTIFDWNDHYQLQSTETELPAKAIAWARNEHRFDELHEGTTVEYSLADDVEVDGMGRVLKIINEKKEA